MDYHILHIASKPSKDANGRFLKGFTPWNKGKNYQMPKNPTKFKKGLIPWNHRPVGSVRWCNDGYLQIKIAETRKWMSLHRYIWQEVNGPIPKGYYIRFKLGANRMNFGIDDLIMVSKAENIKLNHNRQKAGETISKLYRSEYIRVVHLGLPPKTKLLKYQQA